MTHMLIRYTVRPDRLDEHRRLLQAVFDELAATRPPGLRYTSYADGESGFVDVVAVEQGGRFSQLESWTAFRGGLDERCTEPPDIRELTVAHAYDGG